MSLLDDIHELQKRHESADRYERVCLDLAASLLENIEELRTNKQPTQVTIWNREDYFDLPDRFELIDGRIRPKEWNFYADLPEERDSTV
jgi:hypothetical protein